MRQRLHGCSRHYGSPGRRGAFHPDAGIGVERILFGSGFPFCDTTESLRKVEELELTVGEREMILAENAQRVLKI